MIWNLLSFICWTCLIGAVLFLGICFWVRWRSRYLMPYLKSADDTKKKGVTVGFFHPYCNAGGGGERVLWTAIRAIQNRYPTAVCVVYTGDTSTNGDKIIETARQRFNIVLPRTVYFVSLNRREWVEAEYYPYFTMLGQSFGSLILAWEAMMKFVPDIYIDTMGYAFSLPLFKYIAGCSVACYVHYPTISTNMLERVSTRQDIYNNKSFISRSPVLSRLKLLYYKLFALAYGLAGRSSEVIMVNSTWTENHILSIWKTSGRTSVVYPPCDTKEFMSIELRDKTSKKIQTVVSIAQFRPEKDHPLQIKSFHKLLSKYSEDQRKSYKLVLVGSCRNEGDTKRVEALKTLCNELQMDEYVEFKLNVPFSVLKDCLAEATIGLHTMLDEHFGIGVVELMAAGTVTLAHNSGGPKLDIVQSCNGNKTGYLADSIESYANAMEEIFSLSAEQQFSLISSARQSCERFSEACFERKFLEVTQMLFQIYC